MALRTLNATWKQLEKLAGHYFGKKPVKTAIAPIDELCQRTNESRIVDALADLLVRHYTGLEKAGIAFALSERKGFPAWTTRFDPDHSLIVVNPVGVFKYQRACMDAVKTLNTPEARESFQLYRLQAFMAELGKLPSRFLLFLLILDQVGRCKEVSKAEKRSTGEVAENIDYLNLLWAFKELETFIAENTGVNLRSEYGIFWYESEWVAGNK